MLRYLGDVRTEMQRVTWPTREETRRMAVVTIATLTVGGLAIWAIDTIAVLGITSFAAM